MSTDRTSISNTVRNILDLYDEEVKRDRKHARFVVENILCDLVNEHVIAETHSLRQEVQQLKTAYIEIGQNLATARMSMAKLMVVRD